MCCPTGAADLKACDAETDDLPARGFTDLLDHLATLTRNTVRIAGHQDSGFDLLALPTPVQRRAFDLLATPVPLRLT